MSTDLGSTAREAVDATLPPHLGVALQPRLVPVPLASHMLGVGCTKTRELIASGDLQSVRIDRRLLVPVAAIDEFVERLLRGDVASTVTAAATPRSRPQATSTPSQHRGGGPRGTAA